MNPRDAGAYLDLGKICRSEGRWPEAEAALKQALELEPQNGWARLELGTLYLDQDKLAEAATESEKAVAIDGNNGWAHCQLGKIYRRQGRWGEAEAAAQKALELDSRDVWAHVELGAIYLDQDRFSEAAAEFERAIALDRNNGGAHCQLGRIYRMQGRWPEAEAALEKALELDSQNDGPRFELGSLFMDRGMLPEAAAEFEKVITKDRGNGWAHCELGCIYRRQGRSSEAETAFKKALGFDPQNGWAHLELGAIFQGQDRFSEAEAEFQKALELDPWSARACIEIGALYQHQSEFLQAAAKFEKAISIDPHNIGAHFCLGHIHLRQGHWAAAEEEFQKAAALDRRNDGAYIGLWAVYRGQGRRREAEAALAQASAINPRSAFACAELVDRLDRDKAVGDSAVRNGSCASVDDCGTPGCSGSSGMGGLPAPGLARAGASHSMRERVFCLLPWTHLHIFTDGSFRPCCAWSGPPLGNARSSALAELWNSPSMKALRSDMMRGRPAAGCWRCYEIEQSGFWSTRQRSNSELSRHRDRERLTALDGTLPRLPVPLLDIRFSNVCNLRCRTCDATQSSAWMEDARALGLPNKGGGIRKSYEDWDTLWGQLQPLLGEGLEEIDFLGGEPLIMEEHYRILDFLLAHGRTGVRLKYITNFSVLRFQGWDVIDLWSRFPNVKVVASLDGSGRRGEYLRKGLSWDAVVANREEMLRRCPGVDFSVGATLSIFNALHLPDFHREWVEKGYIERNGFALNMLLAPAMYRMRVLPTALKSRVLESYRRHCESFLDAEGLSARDFAAAARFLEAQDCSELLPEFVAMTRRLDALRGEDCREVFPELAALFEAAE